MDGRLTSPEEVQDDAPVNLKNMKNSGQRESDARKGFKQASGTPLPGEDVDASEHEDEEGNSKTDAQYLHACKKPNCSSCI